MNNINQKNKLLIKKLKRGNACKSSVEKQSINGSEGEFSSREWMDPLS